MKLLNLKKQKAEDLGQYFSALSNEANLKAHVGAWLVLGVKDNIPLKRYVDKICHYSA